MAAASPKHAIRREFFALILCLLAVIFSIEAKTAWYMPLHTLGSEVQAAKALPADVPQVIPHGFPGQIPPFFLLPFTVLFAFADRYFRRPALLRSTQEDDRSPSSSSAFSRNYLRPPPVL